jgi:type II secretory pathway pseudopilin PulG
MNQRNLHVTVQSSRGFSTLEVLLVMVVSLIIAMFAIPGFNQVQRTLRISGDARDLNGAINQAKMMAAANFTESRVYLDLTPLSPANPLAKYHIDIWNKALNGGNGCWQTVGDFVPGPPPQPRCITGTSPVQYLSPGVSFGFAGVGAPPPNTQAGGIAQGTAGERCTPVNGKRVGQQATTACIQFNSRGVPIDINTGVPTGNGAFYITDNTQVYGVTLAATGLSQVWANNIKGNANWYSK